MSHSFRELMADAEKESRKFIGPIKPMTFDELCAVTEKIGAPISEAPPEAIAAVMAFAGLMDEMIKQDPSQN